jgi:hypothetical protein
MPIAAITSALSNGFSTAHEAWSQLSTLRKISLVSGAALMTAGTYMLLRPRPTPVAVVIEPHKKSPIKEEKEEDESFDESGMPIWSLGLKEGVVFDDWSSFEEEEDGPAVGTKGKHPIVTQWPSLDDSSEEESDEEEIGRAGKLDWAISHGVGGHTLFDLIHRKEAVDENVSRLQKLAAALMNQLGGYWGNDPEKFKTAVGRVRNAAEPILKFLREKSGEVETQISALTTGSSNFSDIDEAIDRLDWAAELFGVVECSEDGEPQLLTMTRTWHESLVKAREDSLMGEVKQPARVAEALEQKLVFKEEWSTGKGGGWEETAVGALRTLFNGVLKLRNKFVTLNWLIPTARTVIQPLVSRFVIGPQVEEHLEEWKELWERHQKHRYLCEMEALLLEAAVTHPNVVKQTADELYNLAKDILSIVLNTIYDHRDHQIFDLGWNNLTELVEAATHGDKAFLAEKVVEAVELLHKGGKTQGPAKVIGAVKRLVDQIIAGKAPGYKELLEAERAGAVGALSKEFQLAFLPWAIDELTSQLESDE